MPCCPNAVYTPLVLDCDGNVRPIRENEFLRLKNILGSGRVVEFVEETHTAEDSVIIIADSTAGAFTITLPPPTKGMIIDIKKVDASANAVTIDGEGSDTIDGAATQLLSSQWDSLTVVADGNRWYII